MTMRLNTRAGDKVIFLGINGYDSEREAALKKLEVGKAYTVRTVNVGDWSSRVLLDEGWFNTVMFANVSDELAEKQAEPPEQEANACWLEYRDAALVAQQTLDREDAYKAGRAWARFLDAFSVIK